MDEALKTASKSGKNNKGRPDFIFKVKDFLIVIENKADTKYHESIDELKNFTYLNEDNIDEYYIRQILKE